MNGRLRYRFLVVLLLLSIPYIAMQLSDEVNWTLLDFLIAGLLLFGVASVIAWIANQESSTLKKSLSILSVVVLFILVWAELAVGIFGTPWAGN